MRIHACHVRRRIHAGYVRRRIHAGYVRRRIHAGYVRRRIHACNMRRRIHACWPCGGVGLQGRQNTSGILVSAPKSAFSFPPVYTLGLGFKV